MSPLLLICDPAYNYSRSFHELLGSHEIDTLHVRSGKECLACIRLHRPQFVLLAEEADSGFLDPVIDGIAEMLIDGPVLFMVGDKPRWQLAEEWNLLRDRCLSRPFHEADFVQWIVSLLPSQPSGDDEREDGVGSGRRSSGISAYDNEGGHLDRVPVEPR